MIMDCLVRFLLYNGPYPTEHLTLVRTSSLDIPKYFAKYLHLAPVVYSSPDRRGLAENTVQYEVSRSFNWVVKAETRL